MHCSSYRSSNFSDPFGRYYTGDLIGRLLVSRITVPRPNVVLDLGAGEGALSRAALAKWTKAYVMAVDSDQNVLTHKRLAGGPALCAFRTDALSPNLANDINLSLESVQAAVCNPPFIRPRWRKQFSEILEAAGLSKCYPAIAEAGAAVLFLAQNLRFLHPGGQVGIIVPDGIVSGLNHRKLRQTLVEEHTITDVIQLPRAAFKGADVKTHIVIIKKGHSEAKSIRIHDFCESGLTSPYCITPDSAVHRLDYSYYRSGFATRARDDIPWHSSRIVDLDPEIQRGHATTVELSSFSRPVFHITDFPESHEIVLGAGWQWTESLASRHKQILAWPGDILLARVGRNLDQKVAMLQSGPVAISDCVYRMRVDHGHRKPLLDYLTSAIGRSRLLSTTSGSGARHLSKGELLNIRFPRQRKRINRE